MKRPALRYHGGKFRLASWIITQFPPHQVYVEPFCGAASVFFQKPPAYAEVINDLSHDVVNLFTVLRDPEAAGELTRQLLLTPYSRSEYEAAFVPAKDPVEIARRTVIRAYMGYGADSVLTQTWKSGFRSDTKRRGGVPAHDWANYPGALAEMTARLQGVVIECAPALKVIAAQDAPGTLFYVDPPYPQSTRASAGSKPKHPYLYEMTDADHAELAGVLRSVAGMVVISGYRCALYDDLYKEWARVDRTAFADGAAARVESLWLSPNVSSRLQGCLNMEAL